MLVSVIIPSYNHEKYIGQAIESVLEQSYPYLELIIIDDGSQDNSVELIKSIKDPRIVLKQQENAGAHAAINRGLNLAQGDYLTILNSDDIYHLDRIAACISSLEKSDSQLVCSWLNVVDGNGDVIGTKEGWKNMLPRWAANGEGNGYWQREDFNLNMLVSNFAATTSNIFFTRTVFEAIGGMKNLRFAHDWDFLLRACKDFRCDVISQPLLNYRRHDSNTITSNHQWMMFEVCWVLANNIGSFENLLYEGQDIEELSRCVGDVISSINFQGCDRLFWILKQFIDVNKRRGLDTDSMLLDTPALRNKFIELLQ